VAKDRPETDKESPHGRTEGSRARDASALGEEQAAAGSSGSIDVQFSSSRLPAASFDPPPLVDESTDITRAPTTEAARTAHPAVDGAEASGTESVAPSHVTDRADPTDFVDLTDLSPEPMQSRSGRTRLVARRAEQLIGQGVSRIGDGIESLGDGVSKIGERAARVPVLGDSVKQLGEGISELGASLHDLPAVAQSKRGRVLLRSLIVAFLLVFTWIAGIVMLQLRDSGKPDFRPLARKILLAVRDGREVQVWTDASPRFQEIVREQRFVDDMADMKRTLGVFQEIAAVNETIVTTSSSGRIGRVALTLQFDKGRARANVSFHRDANRWKLLGIAVDSPPELPITLESRKARSELPEEVRLAAIKVLQTASARAGLRPAPTTDGSSARASAEARDRDATHITVRDADFDRRSEAVWEMASAVFHSSTSRAEFVRLQRERYDTLGDFLRVIEYRSGSKKFADLSATFTGLVEYQLSVVSVALNFGRADEQAPWLLNSFKIVLPMPRPNESASGSEVPASDRTRPGARPVRSSEREPAKDADEDSADPELPGSADPPAPTR
jgi:hypothetical protein